MQSHVEKTTAAVIEDAQKGMTVLHVTQDFLTFDVANQMMRILLQRPKPHSALLLESLMNSSELLDYFYILS